MNSITMPSPTAPAMTLWRTESCAQGGAHLPLLDHLHRHREGAVLELGDDVLRLVQRELPLDDALTVDAGVDPGSGEDHPVQHDGQVASDVLLGVLAEDAGPFVVPAEVDVGAVALVEADADLAGDPGPSPVRMVGYCPGWSTVPGGTGLAPTSTNSSSPVSPKRRTARSRSSWVSIPGISTTMRLVALHLDHRLGRAERVDPLLDHRRAPLPGRRGRRLARRGGPPAAPASPPAGRAPARPGSRCRRPDRRP